MRNGVQAFLGDLLAAGRAFSETAIGNSFERRLDRPDLHQPGASKALQNLVAFTLGSTFLVIGIGRLTQFHLYVFQSPGQLLQPIAQTLLEMHNISHEDCLRLVLTSLIYRPKLI